jgi:hypothetical protein
VLIVIKCDRYSFCAGAFTQREQLSLEFGFAHQSVVRVVPARGIAYRALAAPPRRPRLSLQIQRQRNRFSCFVAQLA